MGKFFIVGSDGWGSDAFESFSWAVDRLLRIVEGIKIDGRPLGVEAKGDRPGHVSSRATINVDVMTLLDETLLQGQAHSGEPIPAPAYRVPGALERVNDS